MLARQARFAVLLIPCCDSLLPVIGGCGLRVDARATLSPSHSFIVRTRTKFASVSCSWFWYCFWCCPCHCCVSLVSELSPFSLCPFLCFCLLFHGSLFVFPFQPFLTRTSRTAVFILAFYRPVSCVHAYIFVHTCVSMYLPAYLCTYLSFLYIRISPASPVAW